VQAPRDLHGSGRDIRGGHAKAQLL
jgi:hypothetical protein